MSLKATLFVSVLFVHLILQIEAYFMMPVIDPEVEYLADEQNQINLDNWRNFLPMIKKRDAGEELPLSKPLRRASSIGGHMLKQPNFLKFDFLRRSFLNQKV